MIAWIGRIVSWATLSMSWLLVGVVRADDACLQAAAVADVSVEGGFWGPRFTTNAKVTLPHNLRFIEATGRIVNFDRAAGLNKTPFQGSIPHDSDVFKVFEGAARTLQVRPGLVDDENFLKLVGRVLAAQQADGFLCAKLTLEGTAETRWNDLRHSHVLYNAGHFFEAAVAHHEATGRDDFLKAAERFADLIDSRFGPGKVLEVPGHQEIEIGLMKLYQATGNERYLKLADFFLDQRGRRGAEGEARPRWADYNQDRVPLKDEKQVVGHAVRAGYTYAAMADVEMAMKDAGYGPALDRLWEDMVGSKMYLTGGSAAGQYYDEGAGDPYHLPNESAYCETCGTIANVLWSHRMALLHADAKYVDVLERALYNGVLSGMALAGDKFFYVNKQASRSGVMRSPSFNPACCQSNMVRLVPQVGAMAYATRGSDLFVNLFVAGEARLAGWRIKVETDYPLDGKVKIVVEDAPAKHAVLALRVPGWARELPVPSGLYRYADFSDESPTVTTSGEVSPNRAANIENGYMKIARKWKAGDVVEMNLPMPVRRVLADERVQANLGRVALQRGPLVYCVEQIDHAGMRTNALVLDDAAVLKAERRSDLLGGVVVITGEAAAVHELGVGKQSVTRPEKLTAVPYYALANRESGSMDIWLARTAEVAVPVPAATPGDSATVTVSAGNKAAINMVVNDGIWGPRSYYRYTPRVVLGGARGSTQWVQYDWEKPQTLNRTAAYWAVDHRSQVYWWKRIRGEDLGVPGSWRVLYLDGDEWKPVDAFPSGFSPFPYTLRLDLFNQVDFVPVTTKAIRLEVTLGMAPCAVQEWRVGYDEGGTPRVRAADTTDDPDSPFDPKGL